MNGSVKSLIFVLVYSPSFRSREPRKILFSTQTRLPNSGVLPALCTWKWMLTATAFRSIGPRCARAGPTKISISCLFAHTSSSI